MKKVLFLTALLTSIIFPAIGTERKDLTTSWNHFDGLKKVVALTESYDLNTEDPKEQKTLSNLQESLLAQGLYLIGFEAMAKTGQIHNEREKDRFCSSYSWSFLQIINYIYPLYDNAVKQKLFPKISTNEHTFEAFAKTHMALLLPFVKSMSRGTFEIASDDKFDPALKQWVESESLYFINLMLGLEIRMSHKMLILAGLTLSKRLDDTSK